MIRKAMVGLAGAAMVVMLGGVAPAEVATDCAAVNVTYPSRAGEATPEAAVEDATALNVPSSLDAGVTVIDVAHAVDVVEVDNGYVLSSYVTCETETVAGPIANAHAAGNFYDNGSPSGLETWPGASPSVVLHWTPEVGPSKRTAIRNGFTGWETQANTVSFSVGSENPNSPAASQVSDCSTAGKVNNEIHYEEAAHNGALAWTIFCFNAQGNITGFETVFDNDPNWYEGSSATVPTGQYDLTSLGTHEAGHATGWDGHLTDADCGSPTRATMCATTPSGVSHWRTLESHDVHTSEAAYN